MGAELPCQRGRHCLVEENPDVRAITGARTFQCGWDVQVTAGFPKCLRVLSPTLLIEINCEEKTGLVLKHRIDAHDEILALIVLAREVPSDRLVRNREESLVRTIAALDSGLFAYSPYQFVGASRLIARPSGPSAFKSARIDIFAAAKERMEQSNLRFRRRSMIDPVVRSMDRELSGDHRLARRRSLCRLKSRKYVATSRCWQ